MKKTLLLLMSTSLACKAGQAKFEDELVGGESAKIEYSLTVNEPVYGGFYQDGPVPVNGLVEPYTAEVYLQGSPVAVNEDGTFTSAIAFQKDYAVVDVTVPEGELRERIPVFAGNDPVDTWPGGLAGRLLPNGMDALGKFLGAQIDSTGWLDGIGSQLPTIDNGTWGLTPVGILQDPTEVALSPVRAGIGVDFMLNNVGLEYEFWYNDPTIGAGSIPMIIQIEQIGIGATADPILESDGSLTLSLYDADLTMQNPEFIFNGNNAAVLEWILQNGSQWILEPIAENLLEQLLTQIGTLELGGPLAFETDLMGSTLAVGLDELYGDRDGIALEMSLSVGETLATDGSYVPIPMIEDAHPDAQLAIVLHEAVLDELVLGQVLPLLNQDLDLSGFAGNIIGNVVGTLDGGDQIPSNATGWCLSLSPGDLALLRMKEGLDPMAKLYLADMDVNIGVDTGAGCSDWLVMNVVGEVGLKVSDGTKIGFDFEIGEGAILYYGASGYDEDAVVEGFGRSLSSLIGLLGGAASIDLADLAGGFGGTGAFGDISISLLDSQKIYDFYDEWPEGLYSVSINLWEQ